MVKRSRLLRSSSAGATRPLDKMFCRDPADSWEVKSAPTPPPPPTPANAAVIDLPLPPPSSPPSPMHVESDLEVAEALPLMSKARIDSPRAPIHSEARMEASEGASTVMFSLDPSSLEPRIEDFALKNPEEMFRSCFLCKKMLEPTDTVFMFGYMRAFCTPFCRAKQMKEEGVVLRIDTKATEVNPTYVEKKS